VNRGLLAACLGTVVGCSSVLGLDPPTLDPCASAGACMDAAADVTAEARPEAGPEAAPACVWDGAVPDAAGTGVRCGGGCEPVVFCASPEVCCQTTSDAGVSTFACASSEGACPGYSIDCVNENDCSGSDVCCHDLAHTLCAGSCTSGGDIACLPGSADDCPTGKKCDVPVYNADAAAPYYTCEP
jgi:hypothetical protein